MTHHHYQQCLTKCKCIEKASNRQLNGLSVLPTNRQYNSSNASYYASSHASSKSSKSPTVAIAKCPSPHPSIKGTRSLSGASTSKASSLDGDSSEKSKENRDRTEFQPCVSSGSVRRKLKENGNIFSNIRSISRYPSHENQQGRNHQSAMYSPDSPDEEDDHVTNGHHRSSDDDQTDDDDSDDDNNGVKINYLKISMPSDCRLKQSITPTNSPQSQQNIQHSPHHAISVLSSILAKYETSGLLERRKQGEEIIWNRQVNSERTSPRMRTSFIAAVTATTSSNPPTDTSRGNINRNNCYCCISNTSTNSPRLTKQISAHKMCNNSSTSASLKARALSLPQCSFADFQQTTVIKIGQNDQGPSSSLTMCCDLHCKCIKVQSASKKYERFNNKCDECQIASGSDNLRCNCTSNVRLTTTNSGDVLETTC